MKASLTKRKSTGVKEVALMKIEGRVLVLMTAVAGLALSGCVSSPTYGTDKTAGAQLLDDMSNMASFGQGKKKDRIDYKPRPDLVRPAEGDKGSLPAPQESLASAGDPSWPESPEQRRKRLRDEITANRDNPNFVSPIEQDAPIASNASHLPGGNSRREDFATRTPTADPVRIAELKKAREQQAQGSSSTRKYLSEPPLAYREPASSATTGELGQDEAQKERERKKAAGGGGKSWRDMLPWN